MSRVVTSLTNPTVKAVRGLHLRKERDQSGLFVAEGLKIVTEAVELGHAPRTLMYGKDAEGHPLLKRAIQATLVARGEVIEVTQDILAKVSRRDNPQAVVAVFAQTYAPLTALDPGAAPCFVALHRVRDPGNLGTIVRTADAAGCGAVILVGECCDPFSVEAVRATMGSIFAVPIVKATEAEFAGWRSSWPGSVVGTLLSADVDHRQATYAKPAMILMGNEQQGLTPEMAALCDVNVKIPMRGRADSLNLSVATGIMIYAAT
ncbi:RNA methyltransferase [Phenylobacterium sp. Root77]|jgi:TrmH family RNA methyltransferase|uniref:TrmH family RNA methyltransferase n=1 Tax=unclassified Phenylobacterium TaxID=2640670 RepID=UPI0006FC4CD8|nr:MULTISPECIES: RNA methyltransferase [unclassified Phenylobacterium]KQW72257.1 RNA methyltransferase [Phenylobacterium sp. Root1277]KQW95910.1 RNA methyltransferase [Phenylobacterium sp. Root1290]KRC44868.1 RNA methyltransferase [Phenylobacterium sp. Root77]